MPVVHIVLHLLLGLLCLAVGVVLCRRAKGRWIGIAAALALGGVAAGVWQRPDLLVAAFPFAETYFYCNLLPLAALLAAPCAVALGKTRFQRIRLVVLAAVLVGASCANSRIYFRPAAMSFGTTIDENGVCRQSSVDLCSAAAVVTLLGQANIATTEEQAARLAFSKLGTGTHILGAYRALKILTRGTTLTVKLRRLSAAELLTLERPAIVTVGLPREMTSPMAVELAQKYEWTPGVSHSVVYLGRSEAHDKLRIADPDFGVEEWPTAQFELLFRRSTLWLEEKRG